MSPKYLPHNSALGKICLKTKSLNVKKSPLRRSHNQQYLRLRRTSLSRLIRLAYLKLLRLKDKPEVVAKGLAVGVFTGCFPFFGMQSLLALLLATVVRGSKVAALAGTWISNPFTSVPIYIFNYKIGKLLLGIENTDLPPLTLESFAAFKELGSTFAVALLTGSFVVGLILGVITYFYGLAILERLHARTIRRRRIRRQK
jgi:uncharacterized protein